MAQLNFKPYHPTLIDVGKVSTIFEFFPSGFVFGLELALYLVGLYAELNSASNGASFKRGHPAKNGASIGETGIFTLFWQYISLIFGYGPLLAF